MNDNPYAPPEHSLEQTPDGPRLRRPDYYYRPLNGMLLAHLIVAIAGVMGLCIIDTVAKASEIEQASSAAGPPTNQIGVFEIIFVFAALAVFLLLIAWHILFLLATIRLASNAHALGVPPPNTTPHFAVLSYFIPIVNFYKPFQAMRQYYKACDMSPGFILPLWWGLHLFFTADLWIGIFVAFTSDLEFDIAFIQYPVDVCLVIFSQLMLTRLAARQAQLAHQLLASSSSPPTALNDPPPMRFSNWGGD